MAFTENQLNVNKPSHPKDFNRYWSNTEIDLKINRAPVDFRMSRNDWLSSQKKKPPTSVHYWIVSYLSYESNDWIAGMELSCSVSLRYHGLVPLSNPQLYGLLSSYSVKKSSSVWRNRVMLIDELQHLVIGSDRPRQWDSCGSVLTSEYVTARSNLA